MPVSYSEEGNKETKARRECAVGVIWELWFEAVLPKAFLVSNIPSSVLVTAGQDTWHGSLACLPAVSWLAGSSICSHAPCQEKPWDKVWEV